MNIPQNDVDQDGNGHGTHCAGIVSSRKDGVAKAANLTAVGVLGSNGGGTMAHTVSGVLWAAEQTSDKLVAAKAEYAATGKARYISFNGGRSQAFDDAVTLLLLLVTMTGMLVLILPPLPQRPSPLVLPLWPMRGPTSPTSASVSTSSPLVSISFGVIRASFLRVSIQV